jgi:hypothetical protein
VKVSKISDQFKPVRSGFDLSTHSFFQLVADAVADKIMAGVNVKLQLQGKVSSKEKITAVLLGQAVPDGDKSQTTDLDDKVRQIIQDLKNPTNLLAALKS